MSAVGGGATLFDLADDLLPSCGQIEIRWAVGSFIGDRGIDDAIDAEGAPTTVGARDEIPDGVLVDQAPRVDDAPSALSRPLICQPYLAAFYHRALQQFDELRPSVITFTPARGINHHRFGRGLRIRAEGLREGAHQLAQRGFDLGYRVRGRSSQ